MSVDMGDLKLIKFVLMLTGFGGYLLASELLQLEERPEWSLM
jgi:hypothetical protein